jgi:hypothetical protein
MYWFFLYVILYFVLFPCTMKGIIYSMKVLDNSVFSFTLDNWYIFSSTDELKEFHSASQLIFIYINIQNYC